MKRFFKAFCSTKEIEQDKTGRNKIPFPQEYTNYLYYAISKRKK